MKLKLASWLHSPSLQQTLSSSLASSSLPSPSLNNDATSFSSLPTVQQLLMESTQNDSDYAKAWLRYGDWAYRAGQKDTFRGVSANNFYYYYYELLII